MHFGHFEKNFGHFEKNFGKDEVKKVYMIYTKLLNAYRINSMHLEKLLAI